MGPSMLWYSNISLTNVTQDEFLLAKILSKCLLSISTVDCRWRSSEVEGDGKIAWILS